MLAGRVVKQPIGILTGKMMPMQRRVCTCHQTSCDDPSSTSYTVLRIQLLCYFFQLAVERGVKNTENTFRVLLTSDAGELRCCKAY